MKIAIFTNQFPSRPQTYFLWEIRSLLISKFEIEIFPIYPEEQDDWQYVSKILTPDQLAKVKVHYLRPGLFPPTKNKLDQYIKFVSESLQIGRSASRYGLSPVIKSFYVALQALKLAQINTTKFHHVLAYWGNYSGTYAYLFHILSGQSCPFSTYLHAGTDLYRDQVYLREKLEYARNIFVVCDFNRQFIQKLYPETFPNLSSKILIHHLGIDLDDYQYKQGGRKAGRIVAVGRLDKQKGFDVLIKSIQSLKESNLEIELEIVGDGEEATNLKYLAERLGILNQVSFSGWVSTEIVKEKIQQASILVHPSPTIGDAVPTVIKEAAALGTPVIASSIAGIPELLDYGRCGVLVHPNNVEELANAIKSLLHDETTQQQLSEAARKFAEENFSINKTGWELADKLQRTASLPLEV